MKSLLGVNISLNPSDLEISFVGIDQVREEQCFINITIPRIVALEWVSVNLDKFSLSGASFQVRKRLWFR
jgi:hypothetical protein